MGAQATGGGLPWAGFRVVYPRVLRVMHILDEEAGAQGMRAIEQIRDGLGGGFESVVHRLSEGRWRGVMAAARAVRRAGEYDIIHAWGPRALAVGAAAGTKPVIYSPPAGATARTARWLRAIAQYRAVEVVCATATQARLMVERGVAVEKCHIVRPGVDFARVRARRDAQLRLALGLAEDDVVVLAAGESDAAAGHRNAAWAASILHTLDPRWRLLLWGRGAEVARVKRFGEQLASPRMLCVAEERLGREMAFEELLPATDMVVVAADGPVGTLPVAIAMAAALPIVATATPTVCELLEDRHTAVLVGDDAMASVIARKIVELREDRSLQWTLADRARTEAYEYFSQTRFLEQWRGVYRQAAAGEKVAVAEVAPGAGSRFVGRA